MKAIGQFVSRLRPLDRVFGQAQLNDLLDSRCNALDADIGEARRRPMHLRMHHIQRILVVERQSSRQHFEEDDPETVNIRSVIDLVAAKLFGATIGRRADRVMVLAALELFHRDVWLGCEPRETQIHHLEKLVRMIRMDHHEVGWLQIAVDDAALMGGIECLADLNQQRSDTFRVQHLVLLEDLVEPDARHVLHDDARAIRIIERRIDEPDRVRMSEPLHEFHFTLKEIAKLRILGDPARASL